MPVTPTPQQFPQWEFDLLKALNAPVSVSNLTALNLWAQSEGNVINNPLATSGKGNGATKCVAQCGTSSPVYEYSSESAGVAQMAQFMGGSNSAGIVHAFQQDLGLAAIYQAINTSKWCKGCQGGKYPEALAAAVGGGSSKVVSGIGTGGSTGSGGGGSSGGGSGGAATQGANLSACVISFPGFLFFSGPCILTKGGVKWLSGVAALLAGTAVGTLGVLVLAAWGFEASGAKSAVSKVSGMVPTPAGQIISAGTRSSGASSGGRSGSSQVRTAGRRESRDIERQFRAAEEQQGPIGPRGGSATNQRIAREQRRGTSIPGAERRRRQPTAEERRRRAEQPF